MLTALVAGTYFFIFSQNGMRDILVLKQREHALQTAILEAKVHREDLARDHAMLVTDTLYITSRANRYNLAKPGDILIRFISEDSLKSQ